MRRDLWRGGGLWPQERHDDVADSNEAEEIPPPPRPPRVSTGGRRTEIKFSLGVVTPGMSRRCHEAKRRRREARSRWDLREDLKRAARAAMAEAVERGEGRGGGGANEQRRPG